MTWSANGWRLWCRRWGRSPAAEGALQRTLDPAALLRRLGARIDPSARVGLRPLVTGADLDFGRLEIGAGAVLEADCSLDLSGPLRVGPGARIGALTRILTGSRGCVIGAGALVGPRAVLLPGVSVAAHAEVAVGAVVRPEVLA